MEKDAIRRFKDVFARAESSATDLPEACALATVDAEGRPSLRVVLLKDVDETGFVFYTNLDSRKARDMAENNRVALTFWWAKLEEQIRVEGRVEPVTAREADAYFATRDRNSQIGAWASRQSDELASREELIAAFETLEKKYDGREVSRPPNWSGYRLLPERIEFWLGRPFRLHERYLYTRAGDGWDIKMLYP